MTSVNIHNRTYKFAVNTFKAVRNIPYRNDTSVVIKQLTRSSTSIGANVIEAQHSATKKVFVNNMSIALRSARETEYWLCLCLDCGLMNIDNTKLLISECQEIAKVIASIRINATRK